MASESHYRVVEGVTAWELESKVKELLNDGWTPQGGVSTAASNEPGGFRFFQAMVRDLKHTPPPIAVAQVAIPVGELPPL